MLTSTFANPWTFLKGGTTPDDTEDPMALQDPEVRIPKEIQSRTPLPLTLTRLRSEILAAEPGQGQW